METTYRRRADGSQARDGSVASLQNRHPTFNIEQTAMEMDVDKKTIAGKLGDARDYRAELLLAASLPVLVFLAFCGKPALFVLSFGAMLSYIFDLLGSIEGTLIVIAITSVGLMGTLLWSTKQFLLESPLNFSVVIVMSILLVFAFFIATSHFTSIIMELAVIYSVAEQLIFATLPLVASSVLAWFLCTEIDSFDLETCFCVCYYMYVIVLGYPRRFGKTFAAGAKFTKSTNSNSGFRDYYSDSSPAGRVNSNRSGSFSRIVENGGLLIPPNVIKVVYILPIFISVGIHISVHHNVLSTTHTRIVGLVVALLFPGLLMSACAQRQAMYYWPLGARDAAQRVFAKVKFFCAAGLMICVYTHPIFDELKSFSGLQEPWPSLLVLGALANLYFAYACHRFSEYGQDKTKEDDDLIASYSRRRRPGGMFDFDIDWILKTAASVFVGVAVSMIALLVHIPSNFVPVCAVGSIALAETYLRPSWAGISKLLLILIAAMSLAITAMSFSVHTVYHLLYTFAWVDMGFDVSMQQFCKWFAFALAAAVVVPTLAGSASSAGSGSGVRKSSSMFGLPIADGGRQEDRGEGGSAGDSSDVLPGGATGAMNGVGTGMSSQGRGGIGAWTVQGGSGGLWEVLGRSVFQVALPAMSALTVAAEVMMREQDWGGMEVDFETIYPTYYMIGTAGLTLLTGAVLCSSSVIGPKTMWVLVLLQVCKMVQMAGVPSVQAAALALCLISYSLPFVHHSVVTLFLALSSHRRGRDHGLLSVSSHTNAFFFGSADVRKSSNDNNSNSSSGSGGSSSTLSILAYVILAGYASYVAMQHLAKVAIVLLLQPLAEGFTIEDIRRIGSQPDDSVSQFQIICTCLSWYCGFLSVLFYTHMKRQRALRSMLAVLSVVCAILATEGILTIEFSEQASEAAVVNADLNLKFHPEMLLNRHTGLLTVLSCALSGVTYLGILSLRSVPVYLLFLLIYSLVTTRPLIAWCFPLALGGDITSTAYNSFPAKFSFAMVLLATVVVTLHSSTAHINSTYSRIYTNLQNLAYICLVMAPVLGMLWTVSIDSLSEYISGISWAAVVVNAGVCMCVRVVEVSLDVRTVSASGVGVALVGEKSRAEKSSWSSSGASMSGGGLLGIALSGSTLGERSSGSSILPMASSAGRGPVASSAGFFSSGSSDSSNFSSNSSSSRSAVGALPTINSPTSSVGVVSALFAVFWALYYTIASRHQSEIDPDLFIPSVCSLFVFTRRGTLAEDPRVHPLAIFGLAASLWWIFSAFYAIFLQGLDARMTGADARITSLFTRSAHASYSPLADQDISVWTNESALTPLLNCVMLMVPMPAVFLSFARRPRESEELMFILAVLCGVSLIGAQVNCIRYLAVAGAAFAAWRCQDVSKKQTRSDRLI